METIIKIKNAPEGFMDKYYTKRKCSDVPGGYHVLDDKGCEIGYIAYFCGTVTIYE